MGPDVRVSAESALFDQDKDTEDIEGVAQSRRLASYNYLHPMKKEWK